MTTKKSNTTPFIARKKAIRHCMKGGWRYMKDINVFLGEDDDGSQIRINIRDLKTIRIEKKVALEGKELEGTRKRTKWVTLHETSYTKVKLLEGGQLGFGDA